MNILFLCTGNSCRSIIAEALLNSLSDKIQAYSAGSQPSSEVHPMALEVLRKNGISTQGLHSKSWDSLEVQPDVVITLCSNAAGETCPAYLGKVLRSHWGMDDPAEVTGSLEEQREAFAKAFQLIKKRLEAFLEFEPEKLNDQQLKQALESASCEHQPEK